MYRERGGTDESIQYAINNFLVSLEQSNRKRMNLSEYVPMQIQSIRKTHSLREGRSIIEIWDQLQKAIKETQGSDIESVLRRFFAVGGEENALDEAIRLMRIHEQLSGIELRGRDLEVINRISHTAMGFELLRRATDNFNQN